MSKVLALTAIVVSVLGLALGVLLRLDPRIGETVRVSSFNLSPDRLSVELSFTGTADFRRSDPCTEDYKAKGNWVGDILEVEIVVTKAEGHGVFFQSFGCHPLGHGRMIELELEEPFKGSEIVNPSSGRRLLFKPPDRLATLGGLPDGWGVKVQSGAPLVPEGGWIRVYSPSGDPSQEVVLVQAFDGEARVRTERLEGRPPTVTIGERRGELQIRKTGEQVLLWRQGGDGFALFAFEEVFSLDELIELAESLQT